eukprot:g1733.t1
MIASYTCRLSNDALQPGWLRRGNTCSSAYVVLRQRHMIRILASIGTVGDPDLNGKATLEKISTLLEQDTIEGETTALELIRSLKESNQIIGFEGGRQIPKRTYTLADLRLHKIDASKLLAPVDTTLSRLKTTTQLAYLALLSVGVLTDVLNIPSALGLVAATAALIAVDQAKTRGGVEFLILEYLAGVFQPSYAKRVAFHEAGHFLIAYLVGLLPKSYTLSAYAYYKKHGEFNIQAGTTFCDSEFQQEVKNGQLKATSLDRITCVALAGVVAEYLTYGHSEGGLNDILQLDTLMRSLKFSQRKVDGELRWAVLNTFILLKRHRKLHWQLADAMTANQSIGDCINLIENKLKQSKEL